MSKVFKAAGDVLSEVKDKLTFDKLGRLGDPMGIFSDGTKKVFKKVWDNPVGKVVIMAVAIYFGGAAFGLWESAAPAVNGAFVGGSAAEGAAAGTAVAGSGGEAALIGGAAADTAAVGGGAVAAAPTSAELLGGAALDAGFGATTAEAAGYAGASAAAGSAGGAAAAGGIVGKAIAGVKAVGTFMAENKLLTAAAFGGIANMMAPDPYEAQKEAYDDYLKRLNENTAVKDIDLGIHTARRQPREAAPSAVAPSAVAPTPVGMTSPLAPQTPAPQAPGGGEYTPPTAQPIPQTASAPIAPAQRAASAGAPPPVAAPTPAYPDSAGLIASRLALRQPGRAA